MSLINIHTDGGSRGNPGPAGAGYLIEKDDQELYRGKKYLDIKTNNQAEYIALLEAIRWLEGNVKNMEISMINFYLDSELVVRQIKGEYRVKNQGLKPWYDDVKNLLNKLEIPYSFFSIPREENRIADKLVNEAIDDHIS